MQSHNLDDELDFSEIDLDGLEDIGFKGFEYFSNEEDDDNPKELDFDN